MSDLEDDGPWISEETGCERCGYEWVSVHPCCAFIECPKCHFQTRTTHAIKHDAWLHREGR